ncbi:MAG: gliding motility-associated C-terminal domain-containing protein [Saprospiraceae bacterium]|nr:gliding motility-associated C-terminal domain-containing protein [Saprospiraceae bacterium]
MKSPFFRYLLIFIITLISVISYAQEDCVNGIDDDGDGLIDIQDGSDCYCGQLIFQEVSGNFEDFSCCPSSFTGGPSTGIYCLNDGWGPANIGTSDYFNTCDYIGGNILPVIPMPIPSGEGAVGMITQENYLETIGTCLENSLLAGSTYNITFSIGFNSLGIYESPLNTNLNIFGTTDCNNFLMSESFSAGCLSDNEEWELLASIPVNGVENDSWLFVSSSFIPNINAEAIAFGMDCNLTGINYHYLDDIQISGDFIVPNLEGDLTSFGDCLDGVTIELPNPSGSQFQWYLDGVAIAGATSNPYVVDDASAEGEYQVMVINGPSCSLSNPIDVQIESNVLEIDGEITEIQCILNNDGMIDITINSPNAPYEVEWSNGATEEDLASIGPGQYTVTVTDDHGCSGTETFVIAEPSNVQATVDGDCVNGVFIYIDDIVGASYQWYLDGQIIADGITNPYELSSDFPGEYYVVADNGTICTESDPIFVDIDLDVLEVNGEVVDILCFGIPTGSITVMANNLNPPLSYTWSNGSGDQEINGLEAGDYTVTVIDDNGCFGVANFTVDTPSPFINNLTVVQPEMGNPGGAGVTSAGGEMPYIYAWSNGYDQPTDDNLAPGSYSITVTDANGCTEVFDFVIISNFVAVEIVESPSCASICDGSILITIDGDNSEYSITWDDINLSGFNPTQLCSGMYSYTVTDTDGAPFSGTVTIEDPPEVSISAQFEDTICTNTFDVELVLIVSGGNGPYSYLWNTGSQNDTLFDLGTGVYTVAVTDFSGCISLDTFVIDSIPILELDFELNPAGCDGVEGGAVNMSINNGVGPFDILWSNDSITEDLIDVDQGWYFVTITDNYGCIIEDSIEVLSNTDIQIEETILPVNCSGENDGTISLEISEGQGPYMLTWSNGDDAMIIDSLAPGHYVVTVIDAVGCSKIEEYNVSVNSNVSITATTTNSLCFGEDSGSIELEITNAIDFSLLWDDGSTNENRYNLSPGEYEFALIDSFGCFYSDQFVLTEGIEINYESVLLNPDCNGANNGLISISPTTASFPIAYEWSTGDTLNQINNLIADIYYLTITDDLGCSKVDTFILSENSDLQLEEMVVDNLCYGQSNGSISLEISGGEEPYSILWNTNENSESLENLSTGEYSVTVIDGNGCETNQIYLITSPDSLYIHEAIELPLCSQESGLIKIEGVGGLSEYSFLWSTGEVTSEIEILPGNSYSVSMTDGNQCTVMQEYIIESISELEITTASIVNPSSANNDGAISINVEGGTPPYSISWSDGQMGSVANSLGFGVITVTVVDANNCIKTLSFTLESSPLIFQSVVTHNLCYDDCMGQVELQIEGGVEPYVINWSNGQTQAAAIDLCNGKYWATLTDGSGAELVTEEYNIVSPDQISIIGQTQDISCFETQDGEISIQIQGGNGPYEAMWSNSGLGQTIEGLDAGMYNVTVIDDNGCLVIETFSVYGLDSIDIEIELLPNDCLDELRTLILNGANIEELTYYLNGEIVEISNQNEIYGLLPGEYELSYEINEQCIVAVETIEIEEVPKIEVTLSEHEIVVFADEMVFVELVIEDDQEFLGYTTTWEVENSYDCAISNEENQCLGITIMASQSEVIAVTVTDAYGCETIIELNLIVEELMNEIYFPNVFSPNDDGINDEFILYSNHPGTIIRSLSIFDRWGNVVFSLSNHYVQDIINWDGTFNGRKMNPSVFVMMVDVEFENGETRVYVSDLTLTQ